MWTWHETQPQRMTERHHFLVTLFGKRLPREHPLLPMKYQEYSLRLAINLHSYRPIGEIA